VKKLLAVVSVLAGLIAAAVGYLLIMKPAQRPASTEKVEATPERIARGEYLTHAVIPCFSCHSELAMDRYGMPAKAGTEGSGGAECWGIELGFPGRVCFPNITADTETGIGAWTDGEIMRAVREGVSKDGGPLFLMPAVSFAAISEEDVRAIVAYLRTLKPVKVKRERTSLDFPLNLLIKLGPKPLAGPVPEPNHNDPVAYGAYLAQIAGCITCHTPVDAQHRPIAGKELSGGQEFPLGDTMIERSPNLTPHATGTAAMTKESFIGVFRAFTDVEAVAVQVKLEENTVMPFFDYARMSDEDLGAIYDYLRSVKPVDNAVVKREEKPKPPS
jgi:mono/diheme cytochrome c family protein